MTQPADEIDAVLAALADPMRRRLLGVLAECGEATATTLAIALPVTRQAVVKHLGVLDRAGLVRSRKAGREVRYLVRPDALDLTARWMDRVAADWSRLLATIKRIAEASDKGEGPVTP